MLCLCPLTVCKMFAPFVVFLLHVLVNIINRVIIELCPSISDEDKTIFNCSFLVMAIVYALVTLKPCNFVQYARYLVGGEIFMQCLHLLSLAQVQCLLLGDILPFLENSWIGCLTLYKVVLFVGTLYILWVHFLAHMEFTICWSPPPDDCMGPCSPSSDCNSSCSPNSPKPGSQCPCYGPTSCPPQPREPRTPKPGDYPC
uniref:Uncharacterized protein n=1 Tax=Cacopsylla melanoneura TaxID=428564 RepID=A0A8D9AY05_9HEMI